MVALIIGMLICVGLALAVVGLVAVPARREGRELLTPKGEEVMAMAKEKTQSTLEKTGDVLSATKDKVTDTVSSSSLRDEADETASRKAS
jgi:Flp pilus assembly protein TadD